MCLRCLRFIIPKENPSQPEFQQIADRMQSAVANGTLKIIQTGTTLGDLGRAPIWDGGSSYLYVLKCTKCGREFQFLMDTYKGLGYWR